MNRAFLLIVLVLVVLVDQITKLIIFNYMFNNFNEINLFFFDKFELHAVGTFKEHHPAAAGD